MSNTKFKAKDIIIFTGFLVIPGLLIFCILSTSSYFGLFSDSLGLFLIEIGSKPLKLKDFIPLFILISIFIFLGKLFDNMNKGILYSLLSMLMGVLALTLVFVSVMWSFMLFASMNNLLVTKYSFSNHFIVPACIMAVLIYLIPTFLSSYRNHHQKLAISLLNIFGGWTIIGWIASIVWAGMPIKKQA